MVSGHVPKCVCLLPELWHLARWLQGTMQLLSCEQLQACAAIWRWDKSLHATCCEILMMLCFMGQVRTLIAKLIGVVFSIAAGLIAGKEGPFVHGGGIVGGGIGSLGSQYAACSSYKTPNKLPTSEMQLPLNRFVVALC